MKSVCTDAAAAWSSVWMSKKSMGLAAGLLLGTSMAWGQPDYAPAHWVPPTSCSKYYTSGNTRQFCVIHDMEGYYLDSISWLNSCAKDTNGVYVADASVYYLINGVQNGQGENIPATRWRGTSPNPCGNRTTPGTLRVGTCTCSAPSMKGLSASRPGTPRRCIRPRLDCNGTCAAPMAFAKDRNHIIGHDEWQNPTWNAWMATNWPQINTTCNNHTDPGQYWNWSTFHGADRRGTTKSAIYWDMNGANLGAGAAPSGTWDQPLPTGAAIRTAASPPGRGWGPARFSPPGSNTTGAYTITVASTQTVNNLYVQLGTVTFTGGQISFKGSGAYYSNYVAAGSTAVFNTPFVGTGSPDKWGTGTTVYNGASSSGGYFTLNEGTLALGNDTALSTGRL